MIIIILAVIAAIVIYVMGSWLWAHHKLRRYKKMLAEISHEEVQERAKKFTYTEKDMINKVTPPLLRAWDEIFEERKKDWGY